uniref:Uncharacterized protein n=1 Tax=Octopus bimaculoides TaxID=37653 RepID=A0A0L8FTR7_OCTBM
MLNSLCCELSVSVSFGNSLFKYYRKCVSMCMWRNFDCGFSCVFVYLCMYVWELIYKKHTQ